MTTDSFKPAYVKDKRVFDPNKAFRRRPGEKIGGSLTPAQRLQASVAFALDEQIKMLNRRFEVMAGDVLVNGSATISGEAYPTRVVNFGRDASLRKVLAGAAKWVAGADFMIQNLEDWAQAVMDLTGIAPSMVVMTTDAWASQDGPRL
jgi:argininosuccinate lyase